MESDQETSAETLVVTPQQSLKSAPIWYYKDENYYFEDGNAVLLLGDQLFKIHKALFTRRSTFFETLFSLPQSTDRQPEGESDEDPIVCYDEIEDFRALCWTLYASPQEILAQEDWETVDAAKLIAVVGISHKYEFTLLKDWALDVLEGHSAINPTGCISKIFNWDRVGRLLILAKRCKRKKLAVRLEADWLGRISEKQGAALRAALDTAERCAELRIFHGKAYYTHLLVIDIFDSRTAKRDPIDLDDERPCVDDIDEGSYTDETVSQLSEQQKLCIYRGFWSLSLLRSRLAQAPTLTDIPSCSAHVRMCIPIWQAWWRKVIDDAEQAGNPMNSPGEIMRMMQRRAAEPMHAYIGKLIECPCDALIRAQARKMAVKFFSTLADRFLIPQ
ncbi:hypothetical protein D9756_005076 [Leucocoprinus leucothites]|uniref:BTB domain-containing protein n=1 Tax=Leucocoprinus leucothites TaxID=201217 RepID=A0A8H5G9P1_9AGAR|nr:hypothetical protein D9756_005076 [Leucoagaricus leucothites]